MVKWMWSFVVPLCAVCLTPKTARLLKFGCFGYWVLLAFNHGPSIQYFTFPHSLKSTWCVAKLHFFFIILDFILFSNSMIFGVLAYIYIVEHLRKYIILRFVKSIVAFLHDSWSFTYTCALSYSDTCSMIKRMIRLL